MIPSMSISRLYDIHFEDIHGVNNEFVYHIKEKPVPIKFLSQLIYGEKDIQLSSHKSYPGLSISDGPTKYIILADEIIDEHECVITPLPKPLNQIEHYVGVTACGMDELVLVIDPLKILAESDFIPEIKINNLGDGQSPKNNKQNNHKKRILVVDDSITTRNLAINSLQAVGYITGSATNGQQALSLLEAENFDCIVTDIDMPIVNGYELTKKIKQHKKYKNTPVIMVSSYESHSDQKKGFDTGANAYLVKSQFDSKSLIETIGNLL